MSPIRTISLLQMNAAFGNPEKNLPAAKRHIAAAPVATERFLLPETGRCRSPAPR
jgi:hypothetical protein